MASISQAHSDAARRNVKLATAARTKAERVTLTCLACSQPFTVRTSQAINPTTGHRKVYCSNACRYTHKRGGNAANAGGGQWMRGASNPNWKGGVNAVENNRRMWDAEVGQWRRRVFARDRHTCQRCGLSPKTRNTLRAHHIATWADHPDRRFDIDNGTTLCRTCHDWVHSKDNVDRELLA